MAFLRFSRDKRGYEHFYLVEPTANRRGKVRARVLYWFRTPPNVKVGREPFDRDVREALEAQNPRVTFDWRKIVETPIPSADAERWRERRRAERAAKPRGTPGPDEAAEALSAETTIAETAERGEGAERAEGSEGVNGENAEGAAVPDTSEPQSGGAASPGASPVGPMLATNRVTESGERRARRRRRRRGRRGRPLSAPAQTPALEAPIQGTESPAEAVEETGERAVSGRDEPK